MPLPGRVFASDEELGKKNDDHRPANGTTPISGWQWVRWQSAPRVRRRRLFVGLIVAVLVYYFFKNIPTDLGPVSSRGDIRVPGGPFARAAVGGFPPFPARKPPRPEVESEEEKHYYDGQIKFYSLAASLHGIAKTMGYRDLNKNVLFAAANLKSASRLIPMACEMSRWNRNSVHFALMGRDDLSISEVMKINGVGPDCDIYWHDARPDYSFWSTEARMEMSVLAALAHIHNFMHPQVFLIDDASSEEPFFIRSMRSTAFKIGKTVIDLPTDAVQRLMWITRLDHGSLKAWHQTYVDILIHAPPNSSGSLIRLLKSIEEADYFGARRPHLTIELPTDIDPPTKSFLNNLVWPPLDPTGAPHSSQVTLRHRISRKHEGTEEASIRFVESFYSAHPSNSHVLVLSPQVQLSPLYYHYLLYNVLEYKHASFSTHSGERENLLGISLDLPARHLNGSKVFSPPISDSSDAEEISKPKLEESAPSPFLWQAPNSNAVLYFGDKWSEFHSFLSSRVAAKDKYSTSRPKYVSSNHPAWTEYLLELIRARGYNILYPNLPESESFATVHNELYQPLEESTASPQSSDVDIVSPPPLDPNEPFIIDTASLPFARPSNPEPPLLHTPLLSILPSQGDLPSLSDLPLLSFSGQLLSRLQHYQLKSTFVDEFRRAVGGCAAGTARVPSAMKADDLFCQNSDHNDGQEGTAKETEIEVEGIDDATRAIKAVMAAEGWTEAAVTTESGGGSTIASESVEDETAAKGSTKPEATPPNSRGTNRKEAGKGRRKMGTTKAEELEIKGTTAERVEHPDAAMRKEFLVHLARQAGGDH